jgi:hypothetical protein
MSLLMEALRKAEEAKRRMQQEDQAAVGKDSREITDSVPASNPVQSSANAFTLEEREPDLTPKYIRDNFTSARAQPVAEEHHDDAPEVDPVPATNAETEYARQSARAASTPTPASARRQQRAAAASVFTAKQHPARNRKTLTILVIVMVLMIPAGGGVLWYLQSAASSSIGINPALANYDLSSRPSLNDNPAPVQATAENAPAATGQSLGAPPAEQPASPQEPGAEQVLAEVAVSETLPAQLPEANTTPTVETVPGPELATTRAPAVPAGVANPAGIPIAPVAAQPVTPTTSVLEITRSRSSSQVNPDLVVAYESLQAGDLTTARRLYEQLLDVLPNNRDALLGLASINLRQSDPVGARELYARLLQLNPRDPLAHTGLLQTMQASDPAEHERTLKSLISQYPDVAQLTLALGNLYAGQQRWSEAQGAYYNALLTASRGTAGPVHPDYAFNLAVSLEQLNEPRAALDYYRRAQALAAEVTPGFDPQRLNSRLAYLEQAQP